MMNLFISRGCVRSLFCLLSIHSQANLLYLLEFERKKLDRLKEKKGLEVAPLLYLHKGIA